MDESQNSNSSCSDKDSLLSNDRNTATMVTNSNSEVIDTDTISNDDKDGTKQHLPRKEENGPATFTCKVDGKGITQRSNSEQGSNVQSKETKTIKSIGKVIENVLKPPSRTSKANADSPIVPSAKLALDAAKRMPGSNHLKHQLPLTESSPKTKPRHEGLPPPAPGKHFAEDGQISKPRQRTLPTVARRSTITGRMKHAGTEVSNGQSNIPKLGSTETNQERDAIPPQLHKGCLTNDSREIKLEAEIALTGATEGVQTESSNSVSSSISIQAFEICDDATTTFSSMKEQAHNHEIITHVNSLEPYPPYSSPGLKSEMPEVLSRESHRHNHKSVRCLTEESAPTQDLPHSTSVDAKVSLSVPLDLTGMISEEISVPKDDT
ncbi:hypothetical protein Goari_016235, partial [Gossypium aridum]|nr:hypothetical protein [Gossypium aridum]